MLDRDTLKVLLILSIADWLHDPEAPSTRVIQGCNFDNLVDTFMEKYDDEVLSTTGLE